MKKFKFIIGPDDPREKWLIKNHLTDVVEFNWLTQELIFLDDSDAAAYSLIFKEEPVNG